tara:strand:- start:2915 stop:3667 length:753 start_codon:yes stop_codon:yes gene_type:complete
MKKVSRIITNTKQVKFFDSNGAEVDGTAEDCRAVGGKYKNRVCVLPNTTQLQPSFTANNISAGQGNNIQLAQNCNVNGNYNEVFGADFATVQGYNSRVTRYGEQTRSFASAKARSQKSVLFYEGVTNSSAGTAEIFLGGVDGKRLEVDESFGMSTIALDIHTVAKYTDAGNAGSGYMHSKAVFQSTGGVLAINGSHTSLFAQTLVIGSLTLAAVSGTPDYISFTLSGDRSGRSMAWSVIVNVYELRTEPV